MCGNKAEGFLPLMELHKTLNPKDTATIWEGEWEGQEKGQQALGSLGIGNPFIQNWYSSPSLSVMQTHLQSFASLR